ncbi:MAG: DUF6387 family protein [Endozoicomonadaceae bacterium]|nr:DUF6387 family protein [Endozoicomonadaceae bacterium]
MSRKLTEKPEWFDLHKYNKLKHFDLRHWIWELTRRLIVLSRNQKKSKKDNILKSKVAGFARKVDSACTATIFDRPILPDSQIQNITGVDSLCVGVYTVKDTDIHSNDGARQNISIPLYINNNEIMPFIKKLLVKTRKNHPNPVIQSQEPVKHTLQKFEKYRILQQVDLEIYASMKRLKITNKCISDWVFPDNRTDVDNIKKTYKRYITMAKNLTFLYKLLAEHKSQ